MTNLEERLQHIKKIQVTEHDVTRAKNEILRTAQTNRIQIVPAIVTVCMFALMCLLIFMPPMAQIKQSATLFEQKITKIEFALNYQPNRILQLSSANYLLSKQVITKTEYLSLFEEMLQEGAASAQKWTKIKNEAVETTYDLVVYLENGEIANFKYYEDYDAKRAYLIDLDEKIEYTISISNTEEDFSWAFYDSESAVDLSVKGPIIVGTLLLFAFLLDLVYFKKYAYLDERGKRKRLSGWVSGSLYVVLILPVIFSHYLIGVTHLGIALVLIFIYFFLTSYLQIRLHVMRPNAVYYKLLLPIYSLCVIVSFLLIFVV
jgi:hypothetical protein